MNRTLTMTALILGFLCSFPKSYASDKWQDGNIIGTVATVLSDGLLIKNLYLKLPDAPLKQGDSYYEYGIGKYAKTNETIFVYTHMTGFKVNDLVAAAIRYQDMHSPDKAGTGKHEAAISGGKNSNETKNEPSDKGDKNQVRAFRVVGILDKLDSDEGINGPVVVGDSTKVEGNKGK